MKTCSRILHLHPIKRGLLEEIMKDSLMKMGHGEELMPYIEPFPDYKDPGQTE